MVAVSVAVLVAEAVQVGVLLGAAAVKVWAMAV
jgi:hypothetical protein